MSDILTGSFIPNGPRRAYIKRYPPEIGPREHISNETFQSTLQITATDRTGLLADITNQLSAMHLFIHNLYSREGKNGMAYMEVTITVNSINHLKSVIGRLSGINGIVSIGRN